MENKLHYKILTLVPWDDEPLLEALNNGYYLVKAIPFTQKNFQQSSSNNFDINFHNQVSEYPEIKYILCTTPAHKLIYD